MMELPSGGSPPANPRYLPTTYGCLAIVFVVLLLLFLADVLRHAAVRQLPVNQ